LVSGHSAVILCAGLGERLRPLTLDRPKCMVEVNGVPVLGRIAGALKAQGVDHLFVNLFHMPQAVTGYFGDGSAFGVDVRYSHEPFLLGSAGAVKQFEEFLPEAFVVVYGDVLCNADLGRLWRKHAETGADATLLVHQVAKAWECGVVEYVPSGAIGRIVEKPARDAVTSDWVNSGVLILNRSVLEMLEPGVASDFGFDVFPRMLAESRKMFAVPLIEDEYVIDIGTFAGLERARTEVRP
jgi:NDP-sugar pyrophosphorylase family protein